jgi:hypothetical protein
MHSLPQRRWYWVSNCIHCLKEADTETQFAFTASKKLILRHNLHSLPQRSWYRDPICIHCLKEAATESQFAFTASTGFHGLGIYSQEELYQSTMFNDVMGLHTVSEAEQTGTRCLLSRTLLHRPTFFLFQEVQQANWTTKLSIHQTFNISTRKWYS